MNNKIEELKKLINNSNNIVFFGGAGVSTESGIKDFRSIDGLYNMNYDYPPETILSHTFFMKNIEEFYKFYKDKMNCLNILPNITHIKLKELEKNKNVTIITQNIDGLHQKAGSSKVLELHGSIYQNYCMECNKSYDAKYIFNSKGIPKCSCGGIIKPNVVLYEESLDQDTIRKAIEALKQADLLIIAGTSLTVYPASDLINYYHGKDIVLINKDPITKNTNATLIFNDKLGDIFSKL